MTTLWKTAVGLIGATQVLTLLAGLWVASDLYEWARWAQENPVPPDIQLSERHPGYLETTGGAQVAALVAVWLVGGAATLGLAAAMGGRAAKGTDGR